MTQKEKILLLNDGKITYSDISKILNVSLSHVKWVIMEDEKYSKEFGREFYVFCGRNGTICHQLKMNGIKNVQDLVQNIEKVKRFRAIGKKKYEFLLKKIERGLTMNYIKAKYQGSNRAYTFKTTDSVVAGDTVQTADGKKLEVVTDTVDMGWVESYGSEKIAVVKKVERWYFTFGSDHAHPGHYVVFEGNFSETREKMCEKYLGRWAFQYSEDEWNKNVVNSAMLGYPIETEWKEPIS